MEKDEEPDGNRSRAAVFGKAAGMLLFVYVSSYFLISRMGRYEPAAFGSNGVKWYMWAPRGFPDRPSTKGMSRQWLFVPLWLLDSRLWHTADKAYDFGYRRNQWDSSASPPQWRVITNPR
jgi:hypothetical protein